jgi:hypothetical protein
MVPEYELNLKDPRRTHNREARRRYIDPHGDRFATDCAGRRSSTPGLIIDRPRTAPYGRDDIHQLLFSCSFRPSIRVNIPLNGHRATDVKECRLRKKVESARAIVSNLSLMGLVPKDSKTRKKHITFTFNQRCTFLNISEKLEARSRREHPTLSARMRQGCGMSEILEHKCK